METSFDWRKELSPLLFDNQGDCKIDADNMGIWLGDKVFLKVGEVSLLEVSIIMKHSMSSGADATADIIAQMASSTLFFTQTRRVEIQGTSSFPLSQIESKGLPAGIKFFICVALLTYISTEVSTLEKKSSSPSVAPTE